MSKAFQTLVVSPQGVRVSDMPKPHALVDALLESRADFTVLVSDDAHPTPADLERLGAPLLADQADVVYGGSAPKASVPLAFRALAFLAKKVTGLSLSHPFSGVVALRTPILQALSFQKPSPIFEAELLVKLAAQLYRVSEVPLEGKLSSTPQVWPRAKTLLRYASTHNDADNLHEGYTTLSHMEQQAPNYNAWLGRRFRQHCGQRVLEIGAGIGTITAQLEEGLERLIALEVDSFYLERLKNRFRGKPHVQPYLSDVALADWEKLRQEHLDTIVLSNVLEHIPDDVGAVQRFRQLLPEGGKLLILVPALPGLYGTMDEAVGHVRRYSREALERLLETNGFTVESLEWMNVVGIPGWYVNGRIFRRRQVPPLQLRLYDVFAPWLAKAESRFHLPIGMSLFAVAKATS